MEKKFLLRNCMILWVILLLGQLHGCNSCIGKEWNALLELKTYLISISEEGTFNYVLPTWSNKTKSDCCLWEGIECSRTSGRVMEIATSDLFLKENSLLNLSLLHPFEELRCLDLSREIYSGRFSGFFDDNEGYKSLRRLKNLEILDLSYNNFNSSIFLFFTTSLKSLILGNNNMEGTISAKALKDLTNLEVLNVSGNRLNGSMSELKDLTKLEILDLSGNRLKGSMSVLTYLKNLKDLDLSYNHYSSTMELQALKDLTNLEVLNLSGNRLNGSMSDLVHLRKLKSLDLSGNYFSSSMELQDFTHLRKLKSLDLSLNDFSSSMELKALKDLTNLEVLKLRGNRFNGSMSVFTHLKKLKALDLSRNDYSSTMELQVFCEMKNMRELNLNENKYVGQLPLCLGRLKGLRVLDLSDNQFNGDLPSSFSSLESLEYLSLLDNNFTGLISLYPLTNLTKLKVLKLSSTSDMVQVEVESILQPKFQLVILVLPFCGLEKIPSFLMYQTRLLTVDLSNNKIPKNIPIWLLENNPEIEVLKLQNNLFTFFQKPPMVHHNLKVLDVSANHIGGLFPANVGRVLPNMLFMNMSRNRFQGSFSSSEMKKIIMMDLSYNNFTGKLPRSFFKDCLSLQYLKLSHNKFEGSFLPSGINITSMRVLEINNNLFTGNIGVGLLRSKELSILSMSNNCLTGAIPSWISKIYLSYLDLSGNQLSGVLPSHVSNSLGGPTAKVFLHDNRFIGTIPDTFLENVEILDLRNNKFSGRIPHFVNTESINILLLRGNSLTGSIRRQVCELRSIRLLDLSDNKFNGLIPSCMYNLSFGNISSGNKGEEKMYDSYSGILSGSFGFDVEIYTSTLIVEELELIFVYFHEIEVKFAAKQRYESYTRKYTFSGILGYMYGMDLSSNELSGIIPAELGDLLKLRALNLSHNLLSGSIPSSFSNLEDIESLDLSYNMLQGGIPQQLTSMISLAVFDVSYNNLSGIIPLGRQFNTFDENSYLENPFLCGKPTNRSCEAKQNPEEADNGEEEEDDEAYVDMLVFYYSAASTYGTMLIGISVLLCLDCPWRQAWFDIIDALISSVKGMLF